MGDSRIRLVDEAEKIRTIKPPCVVRVNGADEDDRRPRLREPKRVLHMVERKGRRADHIGLSFAGCAKHARTDRAAVKRPQDIVAGYAKAVCGAGGRAKNGRKPRSD